MTRIKVVSFVLGGNHGQFLQAYGLRLFIAETRVGSKIEHCLYHNHWRKELYSQLKSLNIIKFLFMLFYWFKLVPFTSATSKADLVIFGSDTIWMKNHPIAPRDVFYFGVGIRGDQYISYAPSCGSNGFHLSDLTSNEVESLRRFRWFGVRDRNTMDFASRVKGDGIEVDLVCDPSLFLRNSSHWIKSSNTSERMISTYIPNRRLSKITRNHFNEIGFSVANFGYVNGVLDWRTQMESFKAPMSFVSSVSQSALLVTSTFHGVMVGLISETPMLVIASPLLMARLEGPVGQCIPDWRFFSMEEFVAGEWMKNLDSYLQDDVDYVALDNFINQSKDIFGDRISTLLDGASD